MGKRSTFDRLPRDYYRTPSAAVLPLVKHLQPGSSFLEPCAGDGALIDTLVDHGYRCTAAYDIDPQAINIDRLDALELEQDHLLAADYIVTNPPWRRDLLHPMILRFSDLAPTWLLFDADWCHTRQATTYLPRLRKIVTVGRVRWFNNVAGKDNAAWHLFTNDNYGVATEFYGHDLAA